MRLARSLVLLEVVVGLALLAGLGVWLLRLQAASIHQLRTAQQQTKTAGLVEELLWGWSASRTFVTLPASGQLNDHSRWRRVVQPVRIAPGVMLTQISVIVTRDQPDGGSREVYRVDWLVPRGRAARAKDD